MKLIINRINGNYFQNILLNHARDTKEVLAAVAYATDETLFNWCLDNHIPLTFYGRLDASIPVNINILNGFLKKKSPNYVCKLVYQYHHAKVIWWKGAGMYIGSANLTNNAWGRNVEAGCFFKEEEITDAMKSDINALFKTLEKNSTPLTEETVNEMEKRDQYLEKSVIDESDFLNSPSFTKWAGLTQISPRTAKDKNDETQENEKHPSFSKKNFAGYRNGVKDPLGDDIRAEFERIDKTTKHSYRDFDAMIKWGHKKGLKKEMLDKWEGWQDFPSNKKARISMLFSLEIRKLLRNGSKFVFNGKTYTADDI